MSRIDSPPRPVVAIVGAGLSGTLLAINLLREGAARVILIERDPERVARGLAYATYNPHHLLNVRASNMSAFFEDPDHFLQWLGLPNADSQNRFVERRTFGAYVQELLEDALAQHPDRLTLVLGEVIGATRIADRWSLECAGQQRLECDLLVLAQGNFPPADLPMFQHLPAHSYYADPWADGAVSGTGEHDEAVLLVGTGLTAVDVTLSLEDSGFRGTIYAISRRGLRPRGHASVGPSVGSVDRPAVTGSRLVAHVRERARIVGWRAAIDELRPHSADLWRRMTMVERARLLRHLRPYWDVHRHRLAPKVNHRIEQLQMTGRLRFIAGKIERAEAAIDTVSVTWRARGSDTRRSINASRIINCTGPLGDMTACKDALVADLRARGWARPDALGLGLDIDRHGRLIDDTGRAQHDLLAIGPLSRGEAWEIVAVPDIRKQAWTMARHLMRSHWVSGEGI